MSLSVSLYRSAMFEQVLTRVVELGDGLGPDAPTLGAPNR